MNLKALLTSWKFSLAVVAVLCVVVVSLIVYGVVTHTEEGLLEEPAQWRSYPLSVCAASYVGANGFAVDRVAEALEVTNRRLGVSAFVASHSNDCDVRVVLGAPVEPGWLDPGGDATITSYPPSCTARTSNVSGELLDLVIQHELGHCLGLAHDTSQDSIMRPTQRASRGFPPRISDSDRELLRSIILKQ